MVTADRSNNKYNTVENRRINAKLFDVNGQEVESLELVSNEFGSVSGRFTAPRGRVTGPMSIRVDGSASGYTSIRVEEYKRPKFYVEVNPPTDPAKLNELVKVSGKASAYTGAAIDSAKLEWRVVREIHYPYWWYWRCWWYPQPGQTSQEIAHGTGKTALDGGFDEPIPKKSSSKKFCWLAFTGF